MLDNIFEGSHLLEKSLNPIKAVVIFSRERVTLDNLKLVFVEDANRPIEIDISIEKANFVNRKIYRKNINLNDDQLTKNIAKNLLKLSQKLF